MSLLKSSITSNPSSEDVCTIVKELLESYSDLTILSDWTGDMPLHLAAFVGATGLIEMLLKAGADANVQNRLGQTALHRCCLVRSSESAGRRGCERRIKGQVLDKNGNRDGHVLVVWRI